jgi:hypothetical protein
MNFFREDMVREMALEIHNPVISQGTANNNLHCQILSNKIYIVVHKVAEPIAGIRFGGAESGPFQFVHKEVQGYQTDGPAGITRRDTVRVIDPVGEEAGFTAGYPVSALPPPYPQGLIQPAPAGE